MRSIYVFVLFTIVFGLHYQVYAVEQSASYAAFRKAFNNEGPDEFFVLSRKLNGSKEVADRRLGLLCLGTAHYRADSMVRALIILDSLEHTLPTGESQLRSVGFLVQAMVFKKLKNNAKAFLAIERSLALLDTTVYLPEYVDLLIVRGEIQRMALNYDMALADLLQAEKLADSIGYVYGRLMAQNDQANIFYDQDRMDEAWNAYLQCSREAAVLGYSRLANSAYSNLGAVAYMTDRYQEAIAIYDSAYHTMKKTNAYLATDLLTFSASAHSAIGHVKEADRLYRDAIFQKQVLGDSAGIAKVHQMWSKSLWSSGRKKEAVVMLEKAGASAKRMGLAELEKQVRSRLGKWYFELENPKEAYLNVARYSLLQDSLRAILFSRNMSELEVMHGTERKERTIAMQKVELEKEREVKRRKGLQRDILLGVCAALVVILALFYRNIMHRKRLAQQEKVMHDQRIHELLKEQEIGALNAMMEGQEKERQRIAKDLHDRLGSMLSAIKLQFGALENRLSLMQGEQQQQYQKVHDLLDHAVGEVRQVSHDMLSGALTEFGLRGALTDLRNAIEVKGEFDVELVMFGLEKGLPRAMEIAAFRVLQELVGNCMKHAKASEISMTITRTDTALNIVVTDNGKGFDTDKPSSGMGMRSIRERAASMGGTVSVDSRPGKGTTVIVELPLA
ncbi:MAG: sensor histidine kinase [Flavobacteriales bacterium]|nr:sensor histidine kinase [Flavobacteriales bacterium]MBK6944719.1 sensor histidine kinase [Flavobacteriales bacterium]MBK7241134.1 sensor histidine kinase [Flavobacteriales bacterium]MBK7295718.1 sensor histidine kinase [Flavobacteriales bacterium]MBK9534373.1 sensor histidine kinase [Flavobacteriales bacterium]